MKKLTEKKNSEQKLLITMKRNQWRVYREIRSGVQLDEGVAREELVDHRRVERLLGPLVDAAYPAGVATLPLEFDVVQP